MKRRFLIILSVLLLVIPGCGIQLPGTPFLPAIPAGPSDSIAAPAQSRPPEPDTASAPALEPDFSLTPGPAASTESAPTETPSKPPASTLIIPEPEPSETPAISPVPVPDSESQIILGAIGVTLVYPKGWNVLSGPEIEKLYSSLADYLRSLFKDPILAENTVRESLPVSVAYKHPLNYTKDFNANINVIVKSVPESITEDIVKLAALAIKEAADQSTIKLNFSKPVATKVGKEKAAMSNIKLKSGRFKVKQRQFYVTHGDNLLIITVSATKDSELKELQSIVDHIEIE